jgi:hypothetical protein
MLSKLISDGPEAEHHSNLNGARRPSSSQIGKNTYQNDNSAPIGRARAGVACESELSADVERSTASSSRAAAESFEIVHSAPLRRARARDACESDLSRSSVDPSCRASASLVEGLEVQSSAHDRAFATPSSDMQLDVTECHKGESLLLGVGSLIVGAALRCTPAECPPASLLRPRAPEGGEDAPRIDGPL